MARYSYKAIDSLGKTVRGMVEATNDNDLERRVAQMGLDLIRYKLESTRKAVLGFQKTHVDRKELITFTYHLEQLLKAGVPIMDGLHDLKDSVAHGHFQSVISSMIENIGSGKTFSQALDMHQSIFDTVYVSMVEVGERSGRLPKVLHDLTEMLKWQDELTAKARKIAIYPAFVLGVVLLVIAFLMTYLVPQLIPFIKLAGEEIPWYTQILIVVSNLVRDYWYIILFVPISLFVLLKFLLKVNLSVRYWMDNLKLKFWLFGPILYKIKVSRFSNYFALMYMSGITVLDAVMMSKNVMGNVVLENALERVHEQISEGESISNSFANVGLFSALVVRMLKVGETTGGMSEALLNVSYFYSREVSEAIDQIEPAIVPAVTVFLGAIVFWVMISIMGPIYDSVVSLSAF